MKKGLVGLGVLLMLLLSACGNTNTENNGQAETGAKSAMEHGSEETSNMDMEHSSSEELPAGLKEATDPSFKVGSKAVINADHMPGMKGATATIVGAYDTTVYAVSYTPTTGGEPVKNHKWVIQEDLENAGETPLKAGETVVLAVDHMPGMKGAKATIDSAQSTTIYMVDYTPTTGGEPVKNHKWVTADELTTP